MSPFTNWTSAAHTIQEAVDVATAGGLVLVDRGVYDRGGGSSSPTITISNRVCMFAAKNITLQSVYGAGETIIRGHPSPVTGGLGANASRGIYVAAPNPDVVIDGFTIEGGYTSDTNTAAGASSGGGVHMNDGVLSNCIIRNNMSFRNGGGVYGTEMYNCWVQGNESINGWGGGVQLNGNDRPVLQNCVIVSNRADGPGGCYMQSSLLDGRIINCTIVYNVATGTSSGLEVGGVHYNFGSSTTGLTVNSIIQFNNGPFGANISSGPMKYWHTYVVPAPSGPGHTNNSTDNPQIYNDAFGYDGHLRATSPCIDAGTNIPEIVGTYDMDGQPRVDGIVDIGADEASLTCIGLSRSGGQLRMTWRVPPDGSFQYQDNGDVDPNWTDSGAVFVTGMPTAVTYGSLGDPAKFSRLKWLKP